MSAKPLGGGGNPLPSTFEEFANTRKCESCGDRVDAKHFIDEQSQCVGCRYGGSR